MELAQKLALVAAMFFFFVGLLSGVWKYTGIRRSPDAVAPEYVSVGHRAALMYAFASLVIERMVGISQLSGTVETISVSVILFFFGLPVFGYMVHGWLNDTDNQLKKPYRLGDRNLPPALVHGSMAALIVGKFAGFLVLGYGVVCAIQEAN